jgi:hypothetical protein
VRESRVKLDFSGDRSKVAISRKTLIRAAALGLAQELIALPSTAHTLPARRLLIERQGPEGLRLTYLVEVVETLRQLMSPAWSPEQFVQRMSTETPIGFERRLKPIRATLEAQTRLITPNATALTLTGWEWPAVQAWQQPITEAVLRLAKGFPMPEHFSPLAIRAHVTASRQALRLQISVPAGLHPVLVVNGPNDQFWLTAALTTGFLDV